MRFNIRDFISALALLFIIVGAATLGGCKEEPISLGNQPTLPVEQNFSPPEKIWTEDDFKKAEIDPDSVGYLARSDVPPDNVTDEDIKLINAHNAKRLQRLQVGRNGQDLAKKE